MVRSRAAVSWSGGKDCCLALMRAAETHDVIAMVTMFGEDGSRSRSHGLTPAVIEAQSARLGLPLHTERCSWETYTNQFLRLLDRLKQHDVTHMIFGDIIGDSHRAWNQRVCAAHGLTPVMPLWGEPTRRLAEEFLARGGEARLVTVRPPLLDDSWLGSTLDHALIERLVSLGVDPCGEFGEYHTVVTNCPLFMSPLRLVSGESVMRGGCWAIDLAPAGSAAPPVAAR
jgi:uncharacterized protein (TIGR00290 family)